MISSILEFEPFCTQKDISLIEHRKDPKGRKGEGKLIAIQKEIRIQAFKSHDHITSSSKSSHGHHTHLITTSAPYCITSVSTTPASRSRDPNSHHQHITHHH
jgi:hypothetical protein